MGELIEVGGGLATGMGFGTAALCLAGIAVYAWITSEPENNDDDDSSPGGGLMQPVA